MRRHCGQRHGACTRNTLKQLMRIKERGAYLEQVKQGLWWEVTHQNVTGLEQGSRSSMVQNRIRGRWGTEQWCQGAISEVVGG